MSILSIKNISNFYTLDGKHQEQALRNIKSQDDFAYKLVTLEKFGSGKLTGVTK